MADVASRISSLEKTLTAQARQQNCPIIVDSSPPVLAAPISPPELDTGRYSVVIQQSTAPTPAPTEKGVEVLLGKGSSSQYFDEVLVSRVIVEENDIRSALSTPPSDPHKALQSPFNPIGILSVPNLGIDLAGLLPTKSSAIELWKNYVDNVEPCNKVLHRPTAEVLVYSAIDDPQSTSAEAMAVIFAVLFISTVILDSNSVHSITGEDKMASLRRFKFGLEQAFAKADFLQHPSVSLLQALSIYLAALRMHNSSRGLWILNGLAIRAAQSIGLHRDGTRLTLSHFDSEIRRRLWWHLLARDSRAAEDHGIHNPTNYNLQTGVKYPLNLDDNELHPEMKELPNPRPGWSELTLGLINIQITRTWNRLTQMISPWEWNPTPDSVRFQVVEELRTYTEGFLQHFNPVIPQQRYVLLVVRLRIRKLDLVTRQQWHNLKCSEKPELFATEDNLVEAVEILEAGIKLASDELLRPYRWSLRAYPQYYMLLYVLWHLCLKPEGPNVGRAWRAVENNYSLTEGVDAGLEPPTKCTVLDRLRAKALAIRQGWNNRSEENDVVAETIHVRASASESELNTEDSNDVVEDNYSTDWLNWRTIMHNFTDLDTFETDFQSNGLEAADYLSYDFGNFI